MITATTTIIVAIIIVSCEVLPMSSMRADPTMIGVRGGGEVATATSGWILQSSSYFGDNNDDYQNKISYLSPPQEEHIIAVVFNAGSGNDGVRITFMQRPRNNPSFSSTSSVKDKLVHSTFRIEGNVIRALTEAAEKKEILLAAL
jgi:hypothetical protein